MKGKLDLKVPDSIDPDLKKSEVTDFEELRIKLLNV
jgi:hypothetical protein